MTLGERGEHLLGERVVHSPAGDDQRPTRLANGGDGRAELSGVRARAGDLVDDWFEQTRRKVVGLRLDVLGQGDERRTAVRRVEHHGQRLGQRLDDLLRPGDPVPVPDDRPERVVGRRRRRTEVLDLLEHGVGEATLERVAGEHQQREPVGHRHAGSGDEVEGTRADRGRGDHQLAPTHRLGIGDRRQGHPLLVLSAPRRQLVACRVQGRPEARDVAVPEDREHAGDQWDLGTVDQRSLGNEIADDGLCGGQPDGVTHGSKLHSSARADRRPCRSHESRTQWCAGSSQNAIDRWPSGPASTLR